jgi:transcriptional regulator with XRE-family HTH domain
VPAPARGHSGGVSDRPNALGEYLRARRALVSPEQAGIASHRSRRVAGLRREEVAMLAGISVDYYLRLERGRDRNPSPQVIDAIARVLRLDADESAHLSRLVGDRVRMRRRAARPQVVPPSVRDLVHSLSHPAYVEGQYFDVLAANALATALSPRITPGRNQLRDVFLDDAERELYPDWDGVTACYVASLRQAAGPEDQDSRLIELVGELSVSSGRFSSLWSRHDVSTQRGTVLELDHPQLGAVRLYRDCLAVSGPQPLHVVVLHPAPGSDAAEKLALLDVLTP